MSGDAIEQQVREIMAGLFALDASDIGSATALGTVEKWDSLGHVNLMMALEQAFGVKIKPADAMQMLTYGDVCEKLRGYVG